MPYVKLDCGILNSTIWHLKTPRDIFMTALLMAKPKELRSPMDQLEIRTLKKTGWVVPVGWYGFVEASGHGIIHQAIVDRVEGMDALELLGRPELESRSPEFEGRRMVRVAGGFVILNFQKYRDKDHTSAARSKRYRERKKNGSEGDSHAVSTRGATQAEAKAVAVEEAKSEAPPNVGPDLDNPEGPTELQTLARNWKRNPVAASFSEFGTPETWAESIAVADAFTKTWGHPAKLRNPKDPRCMFIVERFVDGFTVVELSDAFKGAKLSKTIAETKDYQTIQTILRDAAQVDKFLALLKPAKASSTDTAAKREAKFEKDYQADKAKGVRAPAGFAADFAKIGGKGTGRRQSAEDRRNGEQRKSEAEANDKRNEFAEGKEA